MRWFWGSGGLSRRLAWASFAILGLAHVVVAFWEIGVR
jgi:hypothetical protein